MLWLIGGTSDSAMLAQALHRANVAYCVTVTTEAGRSLYTGLCPFGRIHVGCLDRDAMLSFVRRHRITAILDASHPFAALVSEGAMATAQQLGLDYLRFERPLLGEQASMARKAHGFPGVTNADDGDADVSTSTLETLLQSERLAHQRVLLILGYRLLHHFQACHAQATLFARILPSPTALAATLDAGFDPRRIIALRPPVAPDLELALWRQWQISMVVAKASGQAGGEDVKRAIAHQLGVELVLLQRPVLCYPRQTHEIAEALAFARHPLRSTELKFPAP